MPYNIPKEKIQEFITKEDSICSMIEAAEKIRKPDGVGEIPSNALGVSSFPSSICNACWLSSA